jgi:hypothetical protein
MASAWAHVARQNAIRLSIYQGILVIPQDLQKLMVKFDERLHALKILLDLS